MAKEQSFNETMKSLFDGMNGFITTKTVVGDAIHVDGAVLIPLIDVSFGMGAGAFAGEKGDKGAGGMNGKLTPSSVLVVKDGYAKVINIKDSNTLNKIIDMVPDIVNRFTKKDSPEVEEAVEQLKKEQ
jgi:uncharacterized spore protein YtfJ